MTTIVPNPEFEAFKKIVAQAFKIIRELETENCAYQMALFNAKKIPIGNVSEEDKITLLKFIEVTVEMAKLSLQPRMAQKYEKALEQFLQQAQQSDLERAASEVLRDWKPEGPLN
jgi:hypothetical protein